MQYWGSFFLLKFNTQGQGDLASWNIQNVSFFFWNLIAGGIGEEDESEVLKQENLLLREGLCRQSCASTDGNIVKTTSRLALSF
jgi:hypothetical protein